MGARLMINPFAPIGRGLLGTLAEIGRFSAFTGRAVAAMVSPPFFIGQFLRQALQIGYFSLPVVGVTAVFIGAALALNIYVGGARFIIIARLCIYSGRFCRFSPGSAEDYYH
jgi:phospholipid/cholesterol/gamma-HCH transport system permease protein